METSMRGWFGAALGGALLLLLAGCVTSTVAAEPSPQPATAPALTERAARLAYLEGDVRIALEGGSEWVEPRLNLTLAGGDRLRTDREARAELRWDRGAVRLDGGSEAELDRLTDTSVRLWLARGVLALRLRALDEDGQVAVGTEAGVLEALRPGDYRVEADDRDGDSLIIVRDGLAEFRAGDRVYRVHAGEMLRVRRGDDGEARVSAAFAPDGFDRWCEEREQRIEQSVAARYVSADTVGYEDLDAYGTWDYAPDYGYVWFPSGLAPGWTPYAFGTWIWVSPWGWTWIDSSPWGYAPYHYGRWARYHDRWCWVPGPRNQRPQYNPAPEGWRHERPVRTGDGHTYRPPLPPRMAPPLSQRARDDRRISFPERPVNPTPPAGAPRVSEPRWPSERPATGDRTQQGERERDTRPERPIQSTREPAGVPRPVAPTSSPPAPAAAQPTPPAAPTFQRPPAPVPRAAPPAREPRVIPPEYEPRVLSPAAEPRMVPPEHEPRVVPPERAPRVAPPAPAPRVMPPAVEPRAAAHPTQAPPPPAAPAAPSKATPPPAPKSPPAAQPQQSAPAQHREREPRERDDGPRR